MRKIICYIKAMPLYFMTGVWCPHTYEKMSQEEGIVMSTNNGFKISDSMLHRENEIVHPKATVIKSKCIYCGHEDISWYDKEPYVIKTE